MEEVDVGATGARQGEEASETSMLAALHCWMFVSGGAIVVVAVVAAVIYFATSLFR